MCNSTSEVISAGLRLLEENKKKLRMLRAALIAGENSGFSNNYSIENIIQKISEE